jgi:UDP-glucose 4-epimerase
VLNAIEIATGRRANRRYLPGRAFDVPESVLSIMRAKKSLGWFPKLSFEQGLERFASWLTHHPNAD